MVRRREEGSELSSRSYLGQCDAIQKNDRHRDSREHRIQSGRSEDRGFWLETSRAVKAFQLRRACDRAFGVGLGGRGRRRMTRPYDRARGCWERIEEEEGRGAGSGERELL